MVLARPSFLGKFKGEMGEVVKAGGTRQRRRVEMPGKVPLRIVGVEFCRWSRAPFGFV